MEPIKTIGQILTGGEQRDCVHIAIMPAVAAEELWRGWEVGLAYGTTDQVKSMERMYGLPAIGIVDPFLENGKVEKGQRVWVFLFPGSIAGLRHHWTLPALDEPHVSESESEEWLRRFADKWNFDYNDMILGAQKDGGYVTAHGCNLHGVDELAPGDEALFWRHIEILTGSKFDQKHRRNFVWSCSC